MRNNGNGRYVIIVLIVLVTLGSGVIWFVLYGLNPIEKVCRMNDGEVFWLSELYDFEWDEVEVINTPSARPYEEIKEFAEYYRENYNGDIAYHYTIALLVFYYDENICRMQVYNYRNSDCPILCQTLPEMFSDPSERFTVKKGRDLFEVLQTDNKTYAILSDDH